MRVVLGCGARSMTYLNGARPTRPAFDLAALMTSRQDLVVKVFCKFVTIVIQQPSGHPWPRKNRKELFSTTIQVVRKWAKTANRATRKEPHGARQALSSNTVQISCNMWIPHPSVNVCKKHPLSLSARLLDVAHASCHPNLFRPSHTASDPV